MKLFLVTILACIATNVVSGQTLEGKKILGITVTAANINISSSKLENAGIADGKYRTVTVFVNTEFTFGKVNHNNFLVAYGLNLGYGSSLNSQPGQLTQKTRSYVAGPVVLFQKFVPLASRIYYSPTARVSGTYGKIILKPDDGSSTSQWAGAATIHPLSLTFNIKPNANLMMLVGYFGVTTNRSDTDNDDIQYSNKASNTYIIATMNYFSFGYQRLF